MSSPYFTAAEAAAELGINLSTLYAYVSRGILQSEPGPDARSRRYRAADVKALKKKKEERADPRKAVERALDWGVPVLDSGLTLIAGGRLFYRGQDALELARRGESLERVAALLWLGDLDAPLPVPPSVPPFVGAGLAPALSDAPTRAGTSPAPTKSRPEGEALWTEIALRETAGLTPFERMQILLPAATVGDPRRYDLRPGTAVATGARLVSLLAAAAAGADGLFQGGAARTLAAAWAADDPEATALIDAALVVSADHELNVSAFTARCVASAGAPLDAAVIGGLAALGGRRHGGYTERVEALLAEVGTRGDSRARLADRLRRGEEIPGFSHTLYPQGDPRGALLLELARERRPGPAVDLMEEVAAALFDLLGERPTLDFGLVTVARALGLPPGAALALFAVGRSAGWIAHALEQIADGRMIRPRARYTGPEP
jgi:citrate synthase